MHDQQNIKFEV